MKRFTQTFLGIVLIITALEAAFAQEFQTTVIFNRSSPVTAAMDRYADLNEPRQWCTEYDGPISCMEKMNSEVHECVCGYSWPYTDEDKCMACRFTHEWSRETLSQDNSDVCYNLCCCGGIPIFAAGSILTMMADGLLDICLLPAAICRAGIQCCVACDDKCSPITKKCKAGCAGLSYARKYGLRTKNFNSKEPKLDLAEEAPAEITGEDDLPSATNVNLSEIVKKHILNIEIIMLATQTDNRKVHIYNEFAKSIRESRGNESAEAEIWKAWNRHLAADQISPDAFAFFIHQIQNEKIVEIADWIFEPGKRQRGNEDDDIYEWTIREFLIGLSKSLQSIATAVRIN